MVRSQLYTCISMSRSINCLSGVSSLAHRVDSREYPPFGIKPTSSFRPASNNRQPPEPMDVLINFTSSWKCRIEHKSKVKEFLPNS